MNKQKNKKQKSIIGLNITVYTKTNKWITDIWISNVKLWNLMLKKNFKYRMDKKNEKTLHQWEYTDDK